jgi:ABC-2 type transport system permease protein
VAGMNSMNDGRLALHRRTQLAAVAWLRWRLFVNALRTAQGKLELLSRILISLAFTVLGLGGAFGMGVLAYVFLTEGKPQMLALFLWIIFFFWQFFPIMAAAFTSHSDSSDLLRFPLGYGSYFLVRLAYGAFDPASVIGSLWLFGILVGVVFAKPALLPWALLVLLAFATFNLLFMQMIFAWVERWLAQRRTREIMGVLFVLLALSFQLIGPLTGRYGKRARPDVQQKVQRFIEVLAPVQRILPPGLAADAIVQGIYPQWPAALSAFALLCAFAVVIAYGLHVRLLAQYRGENLNEAAASALPKDRQLRLGWKLPGFPTQVAAVFEKEVRYLLRSGPMLLTLIMPIFALVVFRLGGMNSARRPIGFLTHAPELAFPFAAAYMLLMLTNLVYNSFGGDAGGIQFFYASPVRFRDIVLAKNLTHAGILALETIVAWTAVALLYGRPALDITIATLAGLLFAAPLNFAVGNVLSMYSPRKLDFSKFGRQRASQMTALMGVVLQLVVVGICVSVFSTARHFGDFWIASLILLLLAGASFFSYQMILQRVDRLALERQELLVAELCRT